MNKPAFNHTAHRELWEWLAEHPFESKYGWPGWEHHAIPAFACFACQYTIDAKGTGLMDCTLCPLDWGNEARRCVLPDSDDAGPYGTWEESLGKISTRKELALHIANLPVREGVEVI